MEAKYSAHRQDTSRVRSMRAAALIVQHCCPCTLFLPLLIWYLLPRTGFDRSIPGYPRYSMTGNPQEGVHNLKIEDARIEDDGEYQCQIGPGPNSKAIRADSKVTVLSKYPAPCLVYLFVHVMSDCLLWKLLVIRLLPAFPSVPA